MILEMKPHPSVPMRQMRKVPFYTTPSSSSPRGTKRDNSSQRNNGIYKTKASKVRRKNSDTAPSDPQLQKQPNANGQLRKHINMKQQTKWILQASASMNAMAGELMNGLRSNAVCRLQNFLKDVEDSSDNQLREIALNLRDFASEFDSDIRRALTIPREKLWSIPLRLRIRAPEKSGTPTVSWALDKPLLLRLYNSRIGDTDEYMKCGGGISELKVLMRGEMALSPGAQEDISTVSATPALRSKQACRKIDNPTSFCSAFPGTSTQLWPCVSIHIIRSQDFQSSCNNRLMLKLMSRYLMEHALDQLARCDRNSPLEPKWVRSERNIYRKEAPSFLRDEDCQEGDMCSCKPRNDANLTGVGIGCSDSTCENKAMNIECAPGRCGSDFSCENQRLQKGQFAKTKLKKFEVKGYGLVALTAIRTGTLIAEYTGEVVTRSALLERVAEYEGERHFYFMLLSPRLFIDGSRRAGIARYINHSCDPNCETEKWNYGGEPHVAIIARREIKPMEEITFSYGAGPISTRPRKCLCGAASCGGWLTPMPVKGGKWKGEEWKEDAEIGSADVEDAATQKIKRANEDLVLAEKMLRKVYNMNNEQQSRV